MIMAFYKILRIRQLSQFRCLHPLYFSHAAVQSELSTQFDKRLPHRIDKREQREPFVKSFFLGKLDTELLAYPEPQNHDRYKAFFEWLKPIEEYIKTVNPRTIDSAKDIPQEVINKLADLGVLGAKIYEDYGGIHLLESEYVKLIETLSLIPSIALYIIKLNKCVDVIQKKGSIDQKLNILPKIASGSIVPTICISEQKNVSDTTVMKVTAVLSNDEQFWILNGEKIFVPYADKANLFIVFCLCSQTNDPYKINETLSVLLIDQPFKNIVLSEPVEGIGIRGLRHYSVNFKDVPISVNNIVGNIGDGKDLYCDFFANKKYNTGGVAIGILKNFINLLTYHVTHNKHFNKMLFEYDSAKEILGKASQALYTMESITYMTTSLIDLYQDQDIALESAMVESYCASESINRIFEGNFLIGTSAYLKSNSYELIMRDVQSLTMFESSVIDTETFVALLGLQHIGKTVNSDIRKLRNPFDYPIFNLLQPFYDKRLKLGVGEHLHPSLYQSSLILERTMFKLKNTATMLFVRLGSQVGENHMDLRRVHELATLIYCLTSVLSRSSRSYCIGLRHSEMEIKTANAFAYYVQWRSDILEQQIADGECFNGDNDYKELSQVTLEKKQYFAEHPLAMNF